jgi:hypothetical protein
MRSRSASSPRSPKSASSLKTTGWCASRSSAPTPTGRWRSRWIPCRSCVGWPPVCLLHATTRSSTPACSRPPASGAPESHPSHAATRAGALDTAGREALLRYVLRPPIAQERVLPTKGGLVRIAQARLLRRNRRRRDGSVVALVPACDQRASAALSHCKIRQGARIGQQVALAHCLERARTVRGPSFCGPSAQAG